MLRSDCTRDSVLTVQIVTDVHCTVTHGTVRVYSCVYNELTFNTSRDPIKITTQALPIKTLENELTCNTSPMTWMSHEREKKMIFWVQQDLWTTSYPRNTPTPLPIYIFPLTLNLSTISSGFVFLRLLESTYKLRIRLPSRIQLRIRLPSRIRL
jgi:hypothetical protein